MKGVFQNWRRGSLSRRAFLRRIGWGGIISFLIGGTVATGRFFFPRVLFESPARFNVGRPSDYKRGTVNTSFKDRYRIWIVRKKDGSFFCLSARCTHLGCTINWRSSEGIFLCPCHGSKFYQNGINFAGPAPRPLDRYKITLTADGQLLVDQGIMYKGVAGIDPDERYPQSLLKLKV